RAMDRGIKTARLPIGDYLEMASRKVLTTNHVNEIMLRWLELGDWGKAFMQVIPKRKGGQLKSQVDSMDEDEEEVEEENGLSGTPRLSEAATGPQVEDHEKSELGDTRVSRNPTDEEWQDLLGEYVHAQKNIKDDKELNARQPILNGKEQVSEHDATDHDRIQKAVDV
ncbi:tRNA (guanine(9)-N(1))-methyltransferase, partial [Cryomyces antarcticus]